MWYKLSRHDRHLILNKKNEDSVLIPVFRANHSIPCQSQHPMPITASRVYLSIPCSLHLVPIKSSRANHIIPCQSHRIVPITASRANLNIPCQLQHLVPITAPRANRSIPFQSQHPVSSQQLITLSHANHSSQSQYPCQSQKSIPVFRANHSSQSQYSVPITAANYSILCQLHPIIDDKTHVSVSFPY